MCARVWLCKGSEFPSLLGDARRCSWGETECFGDWGVSIFVVDHWRMFGVKVVFYLNVKNFLYRSAMK